MTLRFQQVFAVVRPNSLDNGVTTIVTCIHATLAQANRDANTRKNEGAGCWVESRMALTDGAAYFELPETCWYLQGAPNKRKPKKKRRVKRK